MEVDYGAYTPQERETLREIAARRGLIATGGSDFHGVGMGAGRELGSAPVSPAAVAALRAAATSPHTPAPSPVEPGERGFAKA
jgi:hypothetical protein